MRTKILLATAILGAVGILSIQAQNVYSVNVVGYVTRTMEPGFNLVCNPMQVEEGQNSVDLLLPEGSVADYTALYKLLASGTYEISTYYSFLPGWDNPTMTIDQGGGVWLQNNSGTAFDVTWVGEVAQGELVNTVTSGFSIQSSQVPQETNLNTIGVQPGDYDAVYTYRGGTYQIATYYSFIPGWDTADPAGPVIEVGEAFFYQNNSGAGAISRTFAVE